jgi:hypothetical protein
MIQYLAGRPVRSQSDLDVGTLVNELSTDFLGNKEVAYSTLKFVFPYIPNDIQYSSLSSSWTEIQRGNSYPFLDWMAFQRMKVSFSFLIAGKRLDNKGTGSAVLVPDGMDASIDDELTILRLMFQSKQPITMYNMDSLLTNAPTALADRPTQFLMTDLTIEAVRRRGTAPLEITTAQVNMTLLETIVEEAGIINIARPKFDEITPTTTTTTTTNNRPDLLSNIATRPVTNSLVVSN